MIVLFTIRQKRLLLLLQLCGSIETSHLILSPLFNMLCMCIISQSCIPKRLTCFFKTITVHVLISTTGIEGWLGFQQLLPLQNLHKWNTDTSRIDPIKSILSAMFAETVMVILSKCQANQLNTVLYCYRNIEDSENNQGRESDESREYYYGE